MAVTLPSAWLRALIVLWPLVRAAYRLLGTHPKHEPFLFFGAGKRAPVLLWRRRG